MNLCLFLAVSFPNLPRVASHSISIRILLTNPLFSFNFSQPASREGYVRTNLLYVELQPSSHPSLSVLPQLCMQPTNSFKWVKRKIQPIQISFLRSIQNSQFPNSYNCTKVNLTHLIFRPERVCNGEMTQCHTIPRNLLYLHLMKLYHIKMQKFLCNRKERRNRRIT